MFLHHPWLESIDRYSKVEHGWILYLIWTYKRTWAVQKCIIWSMDFSTVQIRNTITRIIQLPTYITPATILPFYGVQVPTSPKYLHVTFCSTIRKIHSVAYKGVTETYITSNNLHDWLAYKERDLKQLQPMPFQWVCQKFFLHHCTVDKSEQFLEHTGRK